MHWHTASSGKQCLQSLHNGTSEANMWKSPVLSCLVNWPSEGSGWIWIGNRMRKQSIRGLTCSCFTLNDACKSQEYMRLYDTVHSGNYLGEKEMTQTDYSIQRVWGAAGQRLFLMRSVGKNKLLWVSCGRWITPSSFVCSWGYNGGATESACHCFSSGRKMSQDSYQKKNNDKRFQLLTREQS